MDIKIQKCKSNISAKIEEEYDVFKLEAKIQSEEQVKFKERRAHIQLQSIERFDAHQRRNTDMYLGLGKAEYKELAKQNAALEASMKANIKFSGKISPLVLPKI